MSTNCRFALGQKRYIIDSVNSGNSGKGYCHEGNPEDDRYLRERVLMVRLGELLEKLIVNSRPTKKYPSGEEYRPFDEERHAIWVASLGAIQASHLNSFDPMMSIQHKFDGKLRRQKEHTQDFTSLSLFRDDVECLLRDLYGDLESEALESVILAVFRIVQELTRYVRPHLWKEHAYAEDLEAQNPNFGQRNALPSQAGQPPVEASPLPRAAAPQVAPARQRNAPPSQAVEPPVQASPSQPAAIPQRAPAPQTNDGGISQE
jgi:hypothetical protein